MLGMQRALALLFPEQCLLCNALVEKSGGLCGACWRDTPFIRSPTCDACGASMPGTDATERLLCDDCMQIPRPWLRGRAVFRYSGGARRFVLAMKHGDRPELSIPGARWLSQVGGDVLADCTTLVPVPISRRRLVRRRYNQSAELTRALSEETGIPHRPDALIRVRATKVHDDLSVAERFANVAGAIQPHITRGVGLKDQNVCVVDDVMTSGATLAETAKACLDAGARHVSVLVLARVQKSP